MTAKWKTGLSVFLLAVVCGLLFHAALLWMLGRDMRGLSDLGSLGTVLMIAAFMGLKWGERK